MIYLTRKWVQMTNQLSVVGVVAGVVTRVGVELRLRLWKLEVVDDVRV